MARIAQFLTTWLALLFTIVALVIVIVLGYPKEISYGGVSKYQALALIDTSHIETRAGTVAYKGLPDSHDFSKHKDYFALYVHRYCSGKKEGEHWKTDFCSDIGSELFDQYRVWKQWGVDLLTKTYAPPLREQGTGNAKPADREFLGVEAIKTMPKAIFICFMIGLVSLILTLLLGCIGSCMYWGKVIAVVFSVIATISGLTTAGLAQYLYPTLVHRTNDYRLPNSNNYLESTLGVHALAGLWAVAVLSLLSTALLATAIAGDRKRRNGGDEKGGPPNGKYQNLPSFGDTPGLIRRATGKFLGSYGGTRYDDTSYETLRVKNADAGRGRSRSRGASREPSREREKPEDSPREERPATRYEPFKHQETPP